LSKCYFVISLILFKSNKLEEAGNILQKSMNKLIDSKNYDILYLNKYISLFYLINSDRNNHESLAKYIKQVEKIIDNNDDVTFTHQNIVYIMNLLFLMQKLNIENPFDGLIE
jgi:flagellar biosynthesis regulator FlbT